MRNIFKTARKIFDKTEFSGKKQEQCCSGALALQSSGGCAQKEEMIRKKAYEFYEKRGYQAGHALEDWLEAEKFLGK